MNTILQWTIAIIFCLFIFIIDFNEVYLYLTSPSSPPVSVPVNLFVDIKRGYDALMNTTLIDNAQYVASISASLSESYIEHCNQQLDSMSSYESATLHVKALVTLMQQMNVFYATMEETWRNIKTYLEIEENDEVVRMKYRLQLLLLRTQMELNRRGVAWIINGKYERHSIPSLYRYMKHYGREKTLVKDEEVLRVDIREFEKTTPPSAREAYLLVYELQYIFSFIVVAIAVVVFAFFGIYSLFYDKDALLCSIQSSILSKVVAWTLLAIYTSLIIALFALKFYISATIADVVVGAVSIGVLLVVVAVRRECE